MNFGITQTSALLKIAGVLAVFGVAAVASAGVPQFEPIASFPYVSPGYSIVSSPVVGFALDAAGNPVPAAYFFYLDQNKNEDWVWVTDGTSSGTHLAVTYPTGGWSLVVDPGLGAYVVGQTTEKGWQLYKTRGPQASTQLLVDVSPLEVLSLDGQLGGNPVFEVLDAGLDSIWLANGASGAAQKIGTASGPSIAMSDKAGFVISGQSPDYGVSSFSAVAPSLVSIPAVPPDSSWIYPHRLGAGRSMACLKNLHQESATLQEELYCSDGTPAGTRRIVPPSIGTGLWLPDDVTFIPIGQRLLFITQTSTLGYAPWITDGTDVGTYSLFDNFLEFSQCSDDRNGDIYFIGATPQDYPQKYLWRTDGTRTNTKPVMPVVSPNDYCSILGTSGPHGPTFLSLGNVLYQTDGSALGTKPVAGAPVVYGLTIVGNSLLAFKTASTEVTLLRLDLDKVFADGFEQ